jgi:hypothetical protein
MRKNETISLKIGSVGRQDCLKQSLELVEILHWVWDLLGSCTSRWNLITSIRAIRSRIETRSDGSDFQHSCISAQSAGRMVTFFGGGGTLPRITPNITAESLIRWAHGMLQVWILCSKVSQKIQQDLIVALASSITIPNAQISDPILKGGGRPSSSGWCSSGLIQRKEP